MKTLIPSKNYSKEFELYFIGHVSKSGCER